MEPIAFDEWLQIGLDRGFCTAAVCSTHDGIPTTSAEDGEFADGFDPCVHILRLTNSIEEQQWVEDNHSPSVWRKK